MSELEPKFSPLPEEATSQWIENVLVNDFPPAEKIAGLTIAQRENRIIPGTVIQLIGIEGKQPNTQMHKEQSDAHMHKEKTEIYLPLSPGILIRVQRNRDNFSEMYTMSESAAVAAADVDVNQLAGASINGVPTIVYKGFHHPIKYNIEYLGFGFRLPFIAINPGDIHAIENYSRRKGYVLALGFPKNPGESIEGDFIPASFSD